MNRKCKSLKLNFLFLLFVISSTFFLSIGYASLDSVTLDINGEVTTIPQSEIYITDVTYKTDSNADTENSKINQYYQTLMQSSIVLGNTPTSSITYLVTIYNSRDKTYIFKDVEYSDEFYDNPYIVFELNGLKEWDTIESKESLTFSITFHYLNNTIPDNNVLNSFLNFKFIIETLDDTNVVTDNKKVAIYNATTDNVKFNVTNNNNFDVNINLKIDDLVFETLSLKQSQTIPIEVNLKSQLNILQANKEYTIMIEQTSPYTVSKSTSVIVKIIPTITNYDLGLKTAGSEDNPYILYKIEDLVRLAKNVNTGTTFASSHIKLLNDLDFLKTTDYYNSKDTSFGNLNANASDTNQILNEMTTGTGFIMIGNSEATSFQGSFDGDNHTISNIYINKTGDTLDTPYGLFRSIKNATIKNTSLSGDYTFDKDGSAFAGNIYGTTKILNCHNYVNITNTQKDKSIGGLLGTLQGATTNVTIDNCSNHGNITNSSGAAAGLVGFVISSTVTITNSYNTGEVSVLGIFGSDQFAAGLVVKDSSGGGTIIIKNSYNSGNITCGGTGNDNVGGLVSLSVGTLQIDSCYNSGKLSGKTNVGGILGSHKKIWGNGTPGKTTITNSFNVGAISGVTYVGGIIGYDVGGNYNISTAYYLTTDSLLNVGSIANNTSCSRTETYMKSSEFITLLGNQFIADTTPFKNNGYPILQSIQTSK